MARNAADRASNFIWNWDSNFFNQQGLYTQQKTVFQDFPGLAKTKFQGFPGLTKLVFKDFQK